MKVVAISDVHEKWKGLVIPECDLLISAGDYSFHGELNVVKYYHEWLNQQPAKHIISLQGNHEVLVERFFKESKEQAEKYCPRVHFIEEGPLEIEGLKIWCSAITPEYNDWAYNRSISEIKRHWDFIPEDIQLLVTHGPPYGICDELYYVDGSTVKSHLGCMHLYEKVMALPNLKCHVFGHIHDGSGIKKIEDKLFVNASICDEMYQPTNPVREFEL